MSLLVSCPGCRSKLRMPDPRAGMSVKCPHCAHKIIFRETPETNGTSAAKPPSDEVEKPAAAEETFTVGLTKESLPNPASSIKPASKTNHAAAPPAKPT